MDALQIGAAADQLAGMPARLFEQHRHDAADARLVEGRAAGAPSNACKAASRSDLTSSATWSAAAAAGVPGRGEYLNENAWAKPISPTRSSVAWKSASLSPGKPTMRSVESARSGRAARSRSTACRYSSGAVAPVHRPQHPIGAALHRQMQKRHQLRHIAVRRDQRVIDIARMRGRVADAGEPGRSRRGPDQIAQAPLPAARAGAVIGVDVLPEQGDLARAGDGQGACLGQHLCRRSRIFGAARIGDDAKGAELVAALLHGQKGADPGDRARFGQRIEFRLGGKAGVDDSAPLFCAARVTISGRRW